MYTRSRFNLFLMAVLSGIFLFIAAACSTDFDYVLVAMKDPGTTTDGLEYDRNDILGYTPELAPVEDAPVDQWYTWFDGEQYGLTDAKHRIGAFSVPTFVLNFSILEDEGKELYMSFEANTAKMPGIGKVQGQDIIKLVINPDDTYEYSLYFNGQAVGLTTASEKVDAITVWTPEFYSLIVEEGPEIPYDCPEGVIFLSTRGNYNVKDNLGGFLRGDGSDILAFCAQNTGEATTGFWYRVWDSSEAEMKQKQALTSLHVILYDSQFDDSGPISTSESGNLLTNLGFFFTTKRPFTARDLTGEGDVSQLFLGAAATDGSHGLVFDFPITDFNGNLEFPSVNGTVNDLAFPIEDIFKPCATSYEPDC